MTKEIERLKDKQRLQTIETRLHAKEKQLEIIQRRVAFVKYAAIVLVIIGAFVIIGRYHTRTNIFEAVALGDIDQIAVYFDSGTPVDVRDKERRTPLHHAVNEGLLYVTEYLLERGADLDAADDMGWSPLHLAGNGGHLFLIDVLVSRGANVNARANNGFTPLHNAAYYGVGNSRSLIISILVENGANMEAKDHTGRTPLCVASDIIDEGDAVATLISLGANPNAADNNGEPPLYKATRLGWLNNTVVLLVKGGANINKGNAHGRTPLHNAADCDVKMFRSVDLASFLLSHGADPNVETHDGKSTPLHQAARFSNLQVARLLVEHKANVEAKDSDGNTPLQTSHINSRIAEYLLNIATE